MSEIVTNILVPGRAHQVLPDGSLDLSVSSRARVVVAAAYFDENRTDFIENDGVIRFEGGWAQAAAGMPKPSEAEREGRLMSILAGTLGVPDRYRAEGIESTTTMDNCLRSYEQFKDVSLLAIVTQLSQADRLLYCARKVFPTTELRIILAPGENDAGIVADEQKLLRQSRILYGWAPGRRSLRLADRAGVLLGAAAGLRPAAKYGQAY